MLMSIYYAVINKICANKLRRLGRAEAIGLTVVTGRSLLHDSIYTLCHQLCILVFKFIIQK